MLNMLLGDGQSTSGRGNNCSSSSRSPKVRLYLHSTLHCEPSLVIDAPPAASVNRLKVALELRRGIDARNQKLVLWRGGKGFMEMDDVRSLDSYHLEDGDRVFLLPIMRAGPGLANIEPQNGLANLVEQTRLELLEMIDERLQADPCPAGGCVVLLRRREREVSEEEPCRSPNTIYAMGEEFPSSGDCEQRDSTSIDAQISSEEMGQKMEALRESLKRNQFGCHSLPGRSSDSSSTMTKSGDAADGHVCSLCGRLALCTRNGLCRTCGGRFCAQHIAKNRHPCEPFPRCSLCRRLILASADRNRCTRCQQPLCSMHTGQLFLQFESTIVQDDCDESKCRLQ